MVQKDKKAIFEKILNKVENRINKKNNSNTISDVGQNQSALTSHPTEKFERFPLSDIQESFIVGRHFNSKHDQAGCHIYLEFSENNLDIERLNTAWKYLIEYHDILHTRILPNSAQQVMKEIPDYECTHHDLTEASPETVNHHLEAVRKQMSHRVYRENEWPLFEIAVSQLPEKRAIIHFSIDELVIDGFSMTLLMWQWYQLYRDHTFKLPRLEISFRDYIVAVKKYEKNAQIPTGFKILGQ